MTEDEISRLHATIDGRVQGVGFRYFVQDAAEALQLTGWVRNRWDGTVEVVAEGPRSTLEKLLSAIRRGPRGSYVHEVKPHWQPGTGEFSRFQVRMTSD